MKIGLNAGHTLTGAGSGAVGVINESKETRRVCQRLTELWKSAGVEVIHCTIDKAASQSDYLNKAVQLANRQDLDWFISIHFNAAPGGKGEGVEVYTYDGRQYQDAVEVCENIATLGFKNRGVKAGSGLYVIRKTKAKSMLIEVCFVNNPDADLYLKKFDDVCLCIAKAIADQIGVVVPNTPAFISSKKAYVRVLIDNLAIRKECSWKPDAQCGIVKKNEVFTVVDKKTPAGSTTPLYKLKSGMWITSHPKYVQYYEK